jgi:Putative zinc-finger
MADDEFSTWDAAYVLGALSPEDRHAFELHLRSCPNCTRAVREVAGLPGLLARADVAADLAEDDVQPPDDLLPRLLTRARRDRRKRRLLTGSGWVAAAASLVALLLVLVLGSRTTTPNVAPPSAMVPVGSTPLTAQVSLTGVSWGTKIELKCTYPADYTDDEPYLLFVVDEDHHEQQVGSWRVLPGKTATMNASTDLSDPDISQVLIKDADGSTVLTLNR